MTAKQQNGNVVDYRVGQLEKEMVETRKDIIKLHAEHDHRIRTIEDFVTRENASGISIKQAMILFGAFTTALTLVAGIAYKLLGG
jgi:hypothetical protein